MALLFMDGFDHYVVADWNKKWTSGVQPNTIAAARNGNGFTYNFETQTIKNLGTNYVTLIVGMAYKKSTSNTANSATGGILTLYDGTTRQLILRHEGNGLLAVRGGTGTLLATTILPFIFSDRYTYIELKATINNTTGSFEVRADGATILSGTNVDTQNTANAFVNAVGIGGSAENSGGNLSFVDDFYVCDTSGSVSNNFLGDIVVKTIRPTGVGTNSNFTPLAGANWENVDETNQDGDTTYVSSTTVGHRDTYAMGDVAITGGAVLGVQVNLVARKEGGVTRGIKPTIKSGATYGLGTEKIIGTGYEYVLSPFTLDPNGSIAWTETSVNAIEAGVDLTT